MQRQKLPPDEVGGHSSRRRRVQPDSPSKPERSSSGFPVKAFGIGVFFVVLICGFQLVLLTRQSEPALQAGFNGGRIAEQQDMAALVAQQRQLAEQVGQERREIHEMHEEMRTMHKAWMEQGPDQRRLPAAAPSVESGGGTSSDGGAPSGAGSFFGGLFTGKKSSPDAPDSVGAPQVPLDGKTWPALQAPESVDYENLQFPPDWLAKFPREDLVRSAREAEKWRLLARNAFKHSWDGYRKTAWGQDEMKPTSGGKGREWGKCGLTLLDSLSTMWLMGLTEEFDEAERWVEEKLDFSHSGMVSFFEITIRALAGLVSAHSLSGRRIFLVKALDLAERLLPAFNRDPGFPETTVDLGSKKTKKGWYAGTILAEAGSIQLEFRYLSQVTGDPKYGAKVDKAMRGILQALDGRGLAPWGLNKQGNAHFQNSHITFGAMGDSYYEYLLKMWLQTSKTESDWLNAWKQSMSDMQERLVFKTQGGLSYIAEENKGKADHKMDHLACFAGGMLVYGARTVPQKQADGRWEPLAAEITETCYQMYHRQPSHLAPECVQFHPQKKQGNDMSVWKDASHYLLRPETAEAIFYMFYYTGDPKYRRMAGEIMEAIEEHTKTTYGYSAVSDVRQPKPHQKDEMESFFLAETLKYLYLTFVPLPQDVLDLDQFVLNTEAHPIRIYKPDKQGFLGGKR